MSAEVLRLAAALMRERAPKRVSPWVVPWDSPGDFCDVVDGADHWLAEASKPVGAHIASWHPAVALAVADWLDAEADEQEVLGSPDEPNVTPAGTRAYSVARAYLGESA